MVVVSATRTRTIVVEPRTASLATARGRAISRGTHVLIPGLIA